MTAPPTIQCPGEPYHCLGRVRCHRYWPGSTPVQLQWELLDAAALCAASHFAPFLAALRPAEEGKGGKKGGVSKGAKSKKH